MKRVLFSVVFILALGIASMAQTTVINDPNAELRPVGSFSAVDISGGVDLYLSQGDEDGVAVSAGDAGQRDRIKTKVDNGVLKIWYQSEGWKYNRGNKKLIAYVSFRSIKRLTASGASDVVINGTMKAGDLDIRLAGASDLKGRIEADKFDMRQSGASDATITGRAGDFEIEASGASNFKGNGFETQNCTAKASGASDVRVTVNKELYATASGASSIYYSGEGNPREVRSSGASNISKRK